MSFGGGSGDINYVISVDDSQVGQKLPNVTQALKQTGQSAQQSVQQMGQMPDTLAKVSAESDKVAISQDKLDVAVKKSTITLRQRELAQKSFGSVLKDSILGISQAVSGIIGLVQQYTQLQRAQLGLQKAQQTEIGQRNKITDLTKKHTAAIKEFGQGSSQALKIERDLSLLQQKHATQIGRVAIMQDSLNQRMVDFGVNILPNIIGAGGGIAQVVLGLKEWRAAQAAVKAEVALTTPALNKASIAARGFGISVKSALIGTGIGAVLVTLGTLLVGFATNWLGIRDAVNAAGEAIGRAVPALKPLLDILTSFGKMLTGDFQEASADTVDASGNIVTAWDEVGLSGKGLKKVMDGIKDSVKGFIDEVAGLDKKKDRLDFAKMLGIKGSFGKDFSKIIDEAIQPAVKNLTGFSKLTTAFQSGVFDIFDLRKKGFLSKLKGTWKSRFNEIADDLDIDKNVFDPILDVFDNAKGKTDGEIATLLAEAVINNPKIKAAFEAYGIDITGFTNIMLKHREEVAAEADDEEKWNAAFADIRTPQEILDDAWWDRELPEGPTKKNPFTDMVNTAIQAFKSGDFSGVSTTIRMKLLDPIVLSIETVATSIPGMISAGIKESISKKPITIEDFFTGTSKVPKGLPGSTGSSGTSHTIAMFINDNFLVPIGKAWIKSQERVKDMMTNHPIIPKLEKGDILGAQVDTSINSVTILQALWDGIAIPFTEGWAKTATYVDTYILSKPLITEIAKLDILGDAVKQTMQLDKWFLEDIATPVGEAWINTVQVPVQAYIKLENIFKDITLDNIMGSVSDAIGGLGQWFEDHIASPARKAWDEFISGIVGYIQGHSAEGDLTKKQKDAIELQKWNKSHFKHAQGVMDELRRNSWSGVGPDSGTFDFRHDVGDQPVPGGVQHWDDNAKKWVFKPWSAPHTLKTSGTSDAEIDRMINEAPSDHPKTGTDEWGRVWVNGQLVDNLGRRPSNKFPGDKPMGDFAYGTPQDQLNQAMHGWFFAAGLGSFGGAPGAPVGDLGGSQIMAEFLKNSLMAGKTLDTLGNSTNTLNGTFLGSNKEFLMLNQSLETTAGSMDQYKARIDQMVSRMNLTGQHYGTPLDASGRLNMESMLGQGSIIGGTSPRQETLNQKFGTSSITDMQNYFGAKAGVTQAAAAANPLDIQARQYVQVTKDLNILNRAFLQIGKTMSVFARTVLQVGKDMNIIARTIVTVVKDLNQLARATLTNIKDNNVFAKTIVTVTKDNNTYAKTTVTVTKDLNQLARATVTTVKDNNQLAKTIVTVTKDLNQSARAIVQNTKDLNIFARALVQTTQDAEDLAEAINSIPKSVNIHVGASGPGLQFAQHGMHETIGKDTLIYAHAGERVDIGRSTERHHGIGSTAKMFGQSGGAGHGAGNDIVLNAVFNLNGNDIINTRALTKKVKLSVGENRDKFG